MGGKRKKYTKPFKREAVSLVLEKGMSRHAVERQLGLGNGVVHRWVKEFQEDPHDCFPGNGNLKPHELENEMILAEDIYTKSGMFLLPKGARLSNNMIKRIIKINNLDPIKGGVTINKPHVNQGVLNAQV